MPQRPPNDASANTEMKGAAVVANWPLEQVWHQLQNVTAGLELFLTAAETNKQSKKPFPLLASSWSAAEAWQSNATFIKNGRTNDGQPVKSGCVSPKHLQQPLQNKQIALRNFLDAHLQDHGALFVRFFSCNVVAMLILFWLHFKCNLLQTNATLSNLSW